MTIVLAFKNLCWSPWFYLLVKEFKIGLQPWLHSTWEWACQRPWKHLNLKEERKWFTIHKIQIEDVHKLTWKQYFLKVASTWPWAPERRAWRTKSKLEPPICTKAEANSFPAIAFSKTRKDFWSSSRSRASSPTANNLWFHYSLWNISGSVFS